MSQPYGIPVLDAGSFTRLSGMQLASLNAQFASRASSPSSQVTFLSQEPDPEPQEVVNPSPPAVNNPKTNFWARKKNRKAANRAANTAAKLAAGPVNASTTAQTATSAAASDAKPSTQARGRKTRGKRGGGRRFIKSGNKAGPDTKPHTKGGQDGGSKLTHGDSNKTHSPCNCKHSWCTTCKKLKKEDISPAKVQASTVTGPSAAHILGAIVQSNPQLEQAIINEIQHGTQPGTHVKNHQYLKEEGGKADLIRVFTSSKLHHVVYGFNQYADDDDDDGTEASALGRGS
ncbi:hypothetical protein F4819DRAFT_510462 [Hypoxylon fuscum]|nr:hypothetical protein F4819DRAFT_510462 [Hypoxylon fuscum]